MTFNIYANKDSMIEVCQRVEQEGGVIGGSDQWDRVIKLSDEIAVKRGPGVTAAEAKAQHFAYQKVDPNIVRVPRVHHFFIDDSNKSRPEGYLFMDYIAGCNLKDADLDILKDVIPRVAKIIAHLGKITSSQVPGPVGGGRPRGYWWGDLGAKKSFDSIADMNTWLGTRLPPHSESVDFTPHPLVLCHMNICRRNIILQGDSKPICLVDWAYAGLYPRFFGLLTIPRSNPFDPAHILFLRATTKLLSLTEEEQRSMNLMQNNCQSY